MSFIQELQRRNFMHQCTNLDVLTEKSDKEPIAAYIGFDCTAKSLHVGNLMQIMILRMLQRHGHKPIVIVGGGTTKIGDPSGKDETRKMLTDRDIKANMEGIKKSLSKFISFGNRSNDAIMIDNSEWLSSLNYIDFLRDYGRLFSVNRMLSMESVKLRLDRQQPLTFLEFNYMIMQSFDFCQLNQRHNCSLQIGGSDQWGNIVMGIDLTRRITGNEVYGITTPLITTSSGVKMGKSASGAIWLNEDMLSPYDYYQFWRNIEDADIVRFSEFYAEFDDNAQQEFNTLAQSNINEAKKQLAFRLTEMCHGQEAALTAQETAIKVFEQGGVAGDLPSFELSELAGEDTNIINLLHMSGLCASKSEARKLLRGCGVRINNEKVTDEQHIIQDHEFNSEGILKLSAGKKKHIAVKR